MFHFTASAQNTLDHIGIEAHTDICVSVCLFVCLSDCVDVFVCVSFCKDTLSSGAWTSPSAGREPSALNSHPPTCLWSPSLQDDSLVRIYRRTLEHQGHTSQHEGERGEERGGDRRGGEG